MTTKTQSYAIIALGGKQYVVREGERLVVDRVGADEGKTFQPGVLFIGGDGGGQLAPNTTVTAKVVGHVRGDKIRIGKRRPKTGYRRQTGFRAALSQIEIQSIGGTKRAAPAPAAEQEPAAPKPKVEPNAEAQEAVAAQPPRGYADLTGAIAALEAAIAAKQEKEG